MTKKWTVREGQRYVQRPSPLNRHVIWEVGAVKAGNAPIPHARLIKVGDPLRSKTISCDTLADPSFYQLLNEPAAPAGRT